MTERTCKNCGDGLLKKQARHGWCNACYLRWYRAGRPDTGPPDAGPRYRLPKAAWARAHVINRVAFEDRLTRYADLLAKGLPAKAAARRVKVSIWTAYRYNGLLRELASVAADDAEHRPLSELMADQLRDLGRADALGGRALDGLAEPLAGALGGALRTAERLPVADQILTHVAHGVMMPRPDG